MRPRGRVQGALRHVRQPRNGGHDAVAMDHRSAAVGRRVRDVAVDGAGHVWIISDAEEGALYRLVPVSD
ncbi:hypothetical protein SDC9_46203 [bioreactor metagenome]|uniref:Uncharacterized protein n=1 Tax=bioreactor metagenome TaxID=1076179 RepID=A0A644W920_9ZZZZ